MLAPSRRQCETWHLYIIRVARLCHGFSYTLWNIRTYLISNSRFTSERTVRFSISFVVLPWFFCCYLFSSFTLFVVSSSSTSSLTQFLVYFPYFEKNESRLVRSPCCLCVCQSPPYKLLNAWTNLYETWYVYYGTWTHLNCILHKSFPSVSVPLYVSVFSLLGKGSVKCMPPFVSRELLGKHVATAKKMCWKRRFYAVRVVLKQSRWSILPRTSRFLISKLAQLWSIWLIFGSESVRISAESPPVLSFLLYFLSGRIIPSQ
jgi:hypothetical protein